MSKTSKKEAIDLVKTETLPEINQLSSTHAKYPTVAEVNAELDSEYGWVGNNVTNINKAILRELVMARLERRKNNE